MPKGFQKGHPCYHVSTRKPENWVKCVVCRKAFYRPTSQANRIKCCSIACSARFRRGQPSKKPRMLYLRRNCEHCAKEFWTTIWDNSRFCSVSCGLKQRVGEKNPAWRGGVTPINQRLRSSTQYEQWRSGVFHRDGFTCQECGQRGGRLNADHIKAWALYPELRFEVENGRTLCVKCHEKTPNYKSLALQN